MDIRQFLDRNHGSIHCRNQYLTYLIFILTERFAITHHDIELPFVLIKQRGELPANSHLDDGLYIFLSHSVTCQLTSFSSIRSSGWPILRITPSLQYLHGIQDLENLYGHFLRLI